MDLNRLLLSAEAFDLFAAWLAHREEEIVGHPRRCFQHPLAQWLFEMTGHVYGVDESRFGRALWDMCFWRPLPQWARLFCAWAEVLMAEPITGAEAFAVLAQVELALAAPGCGELVEGGNVR